MKLPCVFFLSIFLALSFSCNTTLEDPDTLDPSTGLVLTSTKTSIPSGGVATTRIIARLPKSAGSIDVTFTTSAGNFVQAGAKTIKQLSDSLVSDYRYAAVTLSSDSTTKGTVFITAEAKTARARISITFN